MKEQAHQQPGMRRLSRADFAIGVHPDCGGIVEIVEYAAVCLACDAQDWSENSGGPYVETLLDDTPKLRDLPAHDPGDEDRS